MIYYNVKMLIYLMTIMQSVFVLFIGAVNSNNNGDFISNLRVNSRSRIKPSSSSSSSSSGLGSSGSRKPNIVLILTDDQDVELGSLNFMPKTLKSIRDEGAEFRHAYVTTPMCCPSRSSLLTGMYVHNHNVYTNNDNCSSTQWQATYERKSFATYLNNAGYRTGYFGKYLNKYNGSYVPPGWREWGGLIMNSKYYNYSINMNGKKIKHGFDYFKDYYPDLIANDSIAFLRQSKKNNAHKPVMLTMSFPAPHGPEDSAPQYSHMFFNVTTHHTPSYDFAPNPDKQWILQVTKNMQPIHKKFTDLLMTKRLQTLQSVDAAVQLVVDELHRLGELDNTYIIYTSDHGYHLGQFGLIKGKSFPFEFDVRVPFLVRGPGIEPGTVVQDIVLNIDLAPTFLDIAGVEAPPHMDGRSVLPLFLNSKRKRMRWPDTFLIESSGRRETPYLKLKIAKSTLAPTIINNFTSTELPISSSSRVDESGEDNVDDSTTTTTTLIDDIDDDEDDIDDEDDLDDTDDEIAQDDDRVEEENEFDSTNSTNKTLIKNGGGEATNNIDNELLIGNSNKDQLPIANKLKRIAIECSRNDMNLPCRINQKWYCVNDNGRWRKHKCKRTTLIPQKSNNNVIGKMYKKCACFTSAGLVYKKVSIKTRHNVNKRHIIPSMERDAIQERIYNLKTQLSNVTDNNRKVNKIADCVVKATGKVNCSTTIYQDRKSWRKSRNRIDNEIFQARQKLEQLREIRRHLIHTRPDINLNKALNQDGILNGSSSLPELNFINSSTTNNGTKRKGKNNVTKVPKMEATTTTSGIEQQQVETSHSHRHHKHNNIPMTTTTSYSSSTSDDVFSSSTSEEPTTKREDYCYCDINEDDEEENGDLEQQRIKEERRRLKEEKMKRKLRKQRKRDQQEKACSSERMNCFYHDKEHWRTAPMWTEEDFCFCMNANNNTYSCVRTINATDNFLYCEFTTGLVTFYNLRIDPFELQNRIGQLSSEKKSFLHGQLHELIACKGNRACTVGGDNHHHHHHHHHNHQQQPGNRATVKDNFLLLHSISSSPIQIQYGYSKRKPIKGGEGVTTTIGKVPDGTKAINYPNYNISTTPTTIMDIIPEGGSRRGKRKLRNS